jgi:hypothetical protein
MELLHRLQIIKDIDPFNQQLLNDCYVTLLQQEDEINRLKQQLGIKDDTIKNDNTEGNNYEGY